jgi:hypothetical protein
MEAAVAMLVLLASCALPVVLAMSVGQGLGALAFVCYLLAIVAEVLEHEADRRELGGRPPGRGA